MKIEEYKKLDDKINNQNFHQGYKNINKIMFFLSIFGHFASIFLAYFMLSNILLSVNDNQFFVFITSIIILGGIELLKRDIFDKFSTQYLKIKRMSKDVLPLFALSLTIIGISFYASISGAKEYSSKEKHIELNANESIKSFNDSINNLYKPQLYTLNNEIKQHKSKKEECYNKKLDIESSEKSRKDKIRIVNDLNKQISERDQAIQKTESDIKIIKDEISKIQKENEIKTLNNTKNQKKDNNKNSVMFIIISTLIEIVILAGVFFNEYYKFRSHREFKQKIEKDPNYQKWLLYEQIIDVVYNKDTKINQKLPSNKNIIEMCKVNDIIVLPKDMISFLKTMNNLGIIKTSGSSRYIAKSKENAMDDLKKQFNIE